MIRRASLLDRSVQQRDARLFVLAVEGAETEPAYFHALEASGVIPRHRVRLYVVSPAHDASAPLYILGEAERVARSLSLQPYDEVWLVYDVDRHSGGGRMQQVIETAEDARRRGWGVALSNPCFELWLLLHVSDDVGAVTDRGASVVELLRSALGAYSKRAPPRACLEADFIERALDRARRLDVDPSAPCPPFPSTRVYALVEKMRRVA